MCISVAQWGKFATSDDYIGRASNLGEGSRRVLTISYNFSCIISSFFSKKINSYIQFFSQDSYDFSKTVQISCPVKIFISNQHKME